MRKAVVAVVAVGALSLTGCSTASDAGSLHMRCEGADKVFIVDTPNTDRGTAMFVVANHPDCK